MLVFIIVAVILLAIDLTTKALLWGGGFTVIPRVLSVPSEKVRNYGAAFGLPVPTWLLIVVTFVILIGGVTVYWRFKQGRKSKLFNVGCAFVLGGALGNLADRIFLGFVRDFIQFDFINFPVMNLADVFLNVGMVLLVIYLVFIYKWREKSGAKTEN